MQQEDFDFWRRNEDTDANTNHPRLSKYSIAKHSFNLKYLIFFDKTKILTSIPYNNSRIIIEALDREMPRKI